MAIKDVILNFSHLLSHFGLSIHPETLRLSKFNDTKALSDIWSFLIDITNFISSNTQSKSPKTETAEELFEVAKLIGFPYWSSLSTSSYACLLFLVWTIEKIQLLPLLEQKIYGKLRKVLNCQSNLSENTHTYSGFESQDIYEVLTANYYQRLKLQRFVREFCLTFSKHDITKDDVYSRLQLPASQISGATILDMFLTNNDDISCEISDLDKIIFSVESLSKFYSDYPVFTKWITSVSYGLVKDDNPEYKLLSSIIDLQAKIEVATTDDEQDDFFDSLFMKCSSGKHTHNANENLDAALFDVEEKIAKQKVILLKLMEDINNKC